MHNYSLLYIYIYIWLSWLCLLSLLYDTRNTNIHAPGGIRICDPSKRSAADPPLRPLGHWDRPRFDPQTVQPVANSYTDWANSADTRTAVNYWRVFTCANVTRIKQCLVGTDVKLDVSGERRALRCWPVVGLQENRTSQVRFCEDKSWLCQVHVVHSVYCRQSMQKSTNELHSVLSYIIIL